VCQGHGPRNRVQAPPPPRHRREPLGPVQTAGVERASRNPVLAGVSPAEHVSSGRRTSRAAEIRINPGQFPSPDGTVRPSNHAAAPVRDAALAAPASNAEKTLAAGAGAACDPIAGKIAGGPQRREMGVLRPGSPPAIRMAAFGGLENRIDAIAKDLRHAIPRPAF